MWTEAAFSASVRTEWESGPINRSLFTSIVKSLKDRKGLKMETSILTDTVSEPLVKTEQVFTKMVQWVRGKFSLYLITMPVAGQIQEDG